MSKIKQAVILAGGRGERMIPLTANIPKCMLKINKEPFLYYLIEKLKINGIKEIIISIGYQGFQIVRYFNHTYFGIDIVYCYEDVKVNTAQRFKNTVDLLDDNFLLLYSDIYSDFNLKKMITRFNKLPLITIYDNKNGDGEYGYENNTRVDSENFITKYDYTRTSKELNGVNIGFMCLNKSVINLIEDTGDTIENVLFPKLIETKSLKAYKTNIPYYYLTDIKSLDTMRRYLNEK